MAVAPYPHLEMHVKDKSIYIGLDEQILPLDRPIYMMRTQKGDIGVPHWCPTFTFAKQLFGAETFNKRSKYYSEQSYFLEKCFPGNGAFIMRVADDTAVSASAVLEVGYQENVRVPQWQRNEVTGRFVLNNDGTRVKINENGEPVGVIPEGDPDQPVYEPTLDTQVHSGTEYFKQLTELDEDSVRPFFGDTEDLEDAVTVLYVGKAGTMARADYAAVCADFAAGNGTPSKLYFYVSREADEDAGTPAEYTALDPIDMSGQAASGLDAANFISRRLEQIIVGATNIYTTTLNFDGSEDSNCGAKTIVKRDGLPVLDAGYYYFTGDTKVTGYEALTNLPVGATIDQYGVLETNPRETYVSAADLSFEEGRDYFTDSTGSTIDSSVTAENFDSKKASLYVREIVTDPRYVSGIVGRIYEKTSVRRAGIDEEAQAAINGVRLVWRVRAIPPGGDFDIGSNVNGYQFLPVATFQAKNPGEWGQSYGFRLFFDKDQNTLAQVIQGGAVKYVIAPVEWYEDDTTPRAITDAYGSQSVTGTIREGVVDPSTDLEIDLKNGIPTSYNGSRELPVEITWFPDNVARVGRLLMKAEIAARDAIKTLYPNIEKFKDYNADGVGMTKETIPTFVDELYGRTDDPTVTLAEIGDEDGHMANVISCVASDGVPYFASDVIGSYDYARGATNPVEGVVDLNADSAFRLSGGTDGPIDDEDIERYIRYQIDACVSGVQDYLIDYNRCPYNNIIDTGVSLKTKKSYLDFMGVRDNLAVFLTPQQIWRGTIDGIPNSEPALLTRKEDEAIGAILRSYGLLMKDDVLNATEANRCAIFLGYGVNNDHTMNKSHIVASTLWIALKNSVYLNKTYIDEEPIERPNSEITCFDKIGWTASGEETRSRCWNAGLNYPQFFDMDGVHYAALRTIYRYDTSVLCDVGTMRAVTFCKDLIRAEWTIWASSKRKADALNSLITKNLIEKGAKMLNHKYDFSPTVYQTDEDKKLGYVRHVDFELESPATNRVWIATVICKREGYDPDAEENS